MFSIITISKFVIKYFDLGSQVQKTVELLFYLRLNLSKKMYCNIWRIIQLVQFDKEQPCQIYTKLYKIL